MCEAEGAVEMSDLMEVNGAMTRQLAGMLRYGRDVAATKLVQSYAVIRSARAACDRVFRDFDVILIPTAPQHAFAFDGPIPQNQADLTALANFAGCPALAMPMPGDGVRGSMQLVGPRWSDGRLLNVAEELARRLEG